jgi:4-hydroxybenzoate polyprenyltransferase
MSIMGYCSLIRVKNQIGTILLFIPCLLGLFASHEVNTANITIFLVSAFLARSCGCILNDIADRKIDSITPSTASRPLANNALSTKQALVFFIALLLAGLPLLLFFSKHIFLPLGITAVLVILYPYSKRFFAVPQIFLGLAYASGFLIAITHSLDVPLYNLHPKAYIFYTALVLWVIIFDTNYAKRDLSFDIQNDIRSSTIFFTTHFKITLVFAITLIIIFTTFLYTHFLLIIFAPFVVAIVYNLRKRNNEAYLFKINTSLLCLVLLCNIMFSIFAWNIQAFCFLGINTTIQILSVFLKPVNGFRLNALCVIPLSLVFLM